MLGQTQWEPVTDSDPANAVLGSSVSLHFGAPIPANATQWQTGRCAPRRPRRRMSAIHFFVS